MLTGTLALFTYILTTCVDLEAIDAYQHLEMMRKQARPTYSSAELELQLQQVSLAPLAVRSDPVHSASRRSCRHCIVTVLLTLTGHSRPIVFNSREPRSAGTAHQVDSGQ